MWAIYLSLKPFSGEENIVDETCLDFSEANDMLPQEKLFTELEKTAIHM